jgi:hypothetical protein
MPDLLLEIALTVFVLLALAQLFAIKKYLRRLVEISEPTKNGADCPWPYLGPTRLAYLQQRSRDNALTEPERAELAAIGRQQRLAAR